MASRPGDSRSRIGSILKEERARQGLDIGAVEESTKIRGKYLRALENEDWNVLPGPAYVRGWLRTYAGVLGLDADALVDEYRTRFEEPDSQAIGIAEPLLGGRKARTARERPRIDRRLLIGALIAGLAVLLLVLGLVGGSDEPSQPDGAVNGRHANGGGKQGEHKHKPTVPDTVELKLAARSDSEVCLVNKGGAVLLDNQLLSKGDEESYEADAFTLSLGFGELELTVNGKQQGLEASEDEPLTWEVVPRGVRTPDADADPECP